MALQFKIPLQKCHEILGKKTISPIISLFIKNVGDKIGWENKSCTPILMVEINPLSVLSPFIDLFLKIISGCLWPRNEDVVTV